MRRELTSLEKQLALRSQVLSDAKSLDETYDASMLEGMPATFPHSLCA
jgi:hypothetical protein